MATLWSILTLVFSLANVLLHGAGIYLLWCLRRHSRLKIQNFYLMSLSGSELLMNLLNILLNLSEMLDQNGNVSSNLSRYILIVNFTGVAFVFHTSMIFITFDRLLELLLNIKYPVYWNEDKTKFLLLGTWIFGMFISITVCCLSGLLPGGFQWERYFFIFFFPSIEVVFVVLAIATYTFIFRKFKNTRQLPVVYIPRNANPPTDRINPINTKKKSPKTNSSCRIFIRSKFFIPVLLILTFFVFVVGADLVYLVVIVIQKNNDQIIGYMLSISYAISNLIDAWIYIFLQREVRSLFIRKFYSKKSFPPASTYNHSTGRIETIT